MDVRGEPEIIRREPKRERSGAGILLTLGVFVSSWILVMASYVPDPMGLFSRFLKFAKKDIAQAAGPQENLRDAVARPPVSMAAGISFPRQADLPSEVIRVHGRADAWGAGARVLEAREEEDPFPGTPLPHRESDGARERGAGGSQDRERKPPWEGREREGPLNPGSLASRIGLSEGAEIGNFAGLKLPMGGVADPGSLAFVALGGGGSVRPETETLGDGKIIGDRGLTEKPPMPSLEQLGLDAMTLPNELERYGKMKTPPQKALRLMDSEGQGILNNTWPRLDPPGRISVVITLPYLKKGWRTYFMREVSANPLILKDPAVMDRTVERKLDEKF